MDISYKYKHSMKSFVTGFFDLAYFQGWCVL